MSSSKPTTVEKKMCTFFLKGECKFGDTCKFSHTIVKTKECDNCDFDVEPCFFYLEGNCKNGNVLKHIQQEIKNNPLAISSNIKNKVSEIKNTLASYNSSNSNEDKNEARKEITKIFRKLATISKRIDRSLEIYTTEFPKIGKKQK